MSDITDKCTYVKNLTLNNKCSEIVMSYFISFHFFIFNLSFLFLIMIIAEFNRVARNYSLMINSFYQWLSRKSYPGSSTRELSRA